MEDLSFYTLDEIYQMLEEGNITIDDLDYYIKNGTIDAEMLEGFIKDGLIEFKDIDIYVKTGYINTSDIAGYINAGVISVEEVSSYIESGIIDANTLAAEVQDINDSQKIEAIQTAEIAEPSQETIETNQPIEETQIEEPETNLVQPVIEEPEENVTSPIEEEQPLIEEPENIMPNGWVEPINIDDDNQFENKNDFYNEALHSMEETYKYCILAGMNIKDISLDGKGGRGPYISFEINNESRQILNHLMSELYASNDGVSLEFMRSMATRDELFTISIDTNNMSREELYEHVRDTFYKIYETVQTTRKDFDYAENMPDGLKNIKNRFRNDDPDIGQDFTIGYVRNDGKDSLYIVGEGEKVAEYAKSIGYEIKNSQGANIFEIETNGSITNTKLAEASVDLSNTQADITQNGISNLDIYGNLQDDPRVEKIENFIETSNDPHLMCILNIEVPPNNPTQRVVTMKSEMGGSETVVFQDGNNFDQKVMPRIIDTYAENNPIYSENISKTSPDELDRASCMVESENNTVLSVNGYSDAETNAIVENVQAKEKTNSEGKDMTNSKQKTIGTYPTNNNQSENDAAFVSMPVLFVVCVLFVLMLSLIMFTG